MHHPNPFALNFDIERFDKPTREVYWRKAQANIKLWLEKWNNEEATYIPCRFISKRETQITQRLREIKYIDNSVLDIMIVYNLHQHLVAP